MLILSLDLVVVDMYDDKTFYIFFFESHYTFCWSDTLLNISTIFVELEIGESFQHSPTAKRCSEFTTRQCEFIYTTFLTQCK